jgi:S-adenosylmethionine hydrolase
MSKFITLLTDFGVKDGYPGIMKGVIWGIVPDAQIADLTHSVSPQNILEGALTLARAVPYFPPGTVHIAVVDPGVGTERRPIAARIGDSFFVGPDNGLFTPLLEKAEKTGEDIQIIHLDRPGYWLADVSAVFHGRDIFAPVGAWLANNTPLGSMGTPINDAIRIEIPAVRAIPGGFRGAVLHIDHFGNLSTNISRGLLPEDTGSVRVRYREIEIPGLVSAFGDGQPGSLAALIDSGGFLSVCAVNGNAAERLNARIGDIVEVWF